MEKLILYARKSTDTEDKQVLSIEAQLNELRRFARDNHLVVIDEMIEKRTAKMPGASPFLIRFSLELKTVKRPAFWLGIRIG